MALERLITQIHHSAVLTPQQKVLIHETLFLLSEEDVLALQDFMDQEIKARREQLDALPTFEMKGLLRQCKLAKIALEEEYDTKQSNYGA